MTRILVAIALLLPTAARADDTSTGHKGQGGISVRLGDGVRGIATYNSDYCGTLDASAKNGNAPVCSGRSPFVMDLEAAYGVAKSIDVTLELEFALEHDFGVSAGIQGPRPYHLAPGARFYFSEEKHSKLFVQPELVFDFTGYQKPGGESRGTDVGVRGIEGYWYDVHRNFGVYAWVGETATFSRWLYFGLELGLGVQGRYP